METSDNGYLGGRLTIRQPSKGYRAGVDPVLLAASVPARAGQSVLELGCGVGTASLCLGWRVPGLVLTGIERQADHAVLARENADANKIDMQVVTGDLADMPRDLRAQSFDHVIANPPYFDRASSTPSGAAAREAAMGEDTALETWVSVAAARLAPKGYASFIHRAERLPDLLAALSGRLGSVQVLPLCPRAGRDPGLVLVRARKGGRAAFRLHAPLVMHEGDMHLRDGDDYSALFRDVLREGAPIPFP